MRDVNNSPELEMLGQIFGEEIAATMTPTLERTTTIVDAEGSTVEVRRLTLDGITATASMERHFSGESWHASIVMSGKFAPEPSSECERATERFPGRNCSTRRPCDTCGAYDDWAGEIIGIANTVTGFALYTHGCNSAHMTGRGFADEPWVSVKPGGRVKITWSGGLDV